MIYHCIPLYTIIYHYIPLYTILYHSMPFYTSLYPYIPLYTTIPTYLNHNLWPRKVVWCCLVSQNVGIFDINPGYLGNSSFTKRTSTNLERFRRFPHICTNLMANLGGIASKLCTRMTIHDLQRIAIWVPSINRKSVYKWFVDRGASLVFHCRSFCGAFEGKVRNGIPRWPQA